MAIFWLLVATMALIAIALVLVPLLRAQTRPDTSRRALNTRIFRDRSSELETDLAEGRLDPQQHAELRAELARTFLDDTLKEETNRPSNGSVARATAALAAFAVPAVGLVYYFQTAYKGPAEEWMHLEERMSGIVARAILDPDNLPLEAQEDLPGFTRALQSHLLAGGTDSGDGWFLLGVSYLQLQAAEPARAALERAIAADPERVPVMVALAQARILADEGKMDAVSARLLGQALHRNPDHQGALLLFAFGAYNTGRYDEAIGAWERLLAVSEPGSDRARLIERSIAQAQAAKFDAAPEPSDMSAPPVALDVTVNLAPDVVDRLGEQDTLFVFARAHDGPRMPLAVVRRPAAGFPLRVTLNDEQAMAPSLKLSNFSKVVVMARISKSGDVAAAPGDLESTLATVDLDSDSRSISLVIGRVLQ